MTEKDFLAYVTAAIRAARETGCPDEGLAFSLAHWAWGHRELAENHAVYKIADWLRSRGLKRSAKLVERWVWQ